MTQGIDAPAEYSLEDLGAWIAGSVTGPDNVDAAGGFAVAVVTSEQRARQDGFDEFAGALTELFAGFSDAFVQYRDGKPAAMG